MKSIILNMSMQSHLESPGGWGGGEIDRVNHTLMNIERINAVEGLWKSGW